jgi:hypothetical protein
MISHAQIFPSVIVDPLGVRCDLIPLGEGFDFYWSNGETLSQEFSDEVASNETSSACNDGVDGTYTHILLLYSQLSLATS